MFDSLHELSHSRYFITGTDTGIGKTFVTCALLRALQQQGKTAIGIKPILTGTENAEDSDTLLLMQHHNSKPLPESMITPFSFPLATSPHIAAAKVQQTIQAAAVVKACQPALSQDVDMVLIEGVGGWRVPLNEHETIADLAAAFACPIILVVGLRLGCLNHALLTAEAIKSDGRVLAGWVANQIDPTFSFLDEYLATLTTNIHAPLLGQIAYQSNANPG
jgi:dethiobiotin synthetase